jgi:hypothetical protein
VSAGLITEYCYRYFHPDLICYCYCHCYCHCYCYCHSFGTGHPAHCRVISKWRGLKPGHMYGLKVRATGGATAPACSGHRRYLAPLIEKPEGTTSN